jgi:glycosyltransferase involved in cell wall biosynthesis
MPNIILSILIPTMPKRGGLLKRLLNVLQPQCTDEVEILIYSDEGRITTGRKRNDLIKQAKGQYIVFVDDDDIVSDTYVSDILNAATKNPDCITFRGWMETDGTNRKEFRLSINYPYTAVWENGNEIYLRYPNHITPVKREIALQVPFLNVTMGEDYAWATELHKRKLLTTEVHINKPLYFYLYQTVKP